MEFAFPDQGYKRPDVTSRSLRFKLVREYVIAYAMIRLLSIILVVCAAPAQNKIEIENDWVRVSRVKSAPHAKASVQDRLPAVVIPLTDLHERITTAGVKVQEIAHKAGEAYYTEAARQSEENISDGPSESVVIELKPGTPKSPPIKLDPVRLDPEHHLVLIDNDRVRAIRTILEPHLKSPPHEHPHYVVVYLTELHTTMTMSDGRVVDNPRRPGDIGWRDALSHVTENIGAKTAEEIQVEIK